MGAGWTQLSYFLTNPLQTLFVYGPMKMPDFMHNWPAAVHFASASGWRDPSSLQCAMASEQVSADAISGVKTTMQNAAMTRIRFSFDSEQNSSHMALLKWQCIAILIGKIRAQDQSSHPSSLGDAARAWSLELHMQLPSVTPEDFRGLFAFCAAKARLSRNPGGELALVKLSSTTTSIFESLLHR